MLTPSTYFFNTFFSVPQDICADPLLTKWCGSLRIYIYIYIYMLALQCPAVDLYRSTPQLVAASKDKYLDRNNIVWQLLHRCDCPGYFPNKIDRCFVEIDDTSLVPKYYKALV